MGPNNPNRLLQETNDLSYRDDQGREVTTGQLNWSDDEAGAKAFNLRIKPYSGWEIEKRFLVVIYDIQGFPAGVGNGQPGSPGGNITVVVSGL